MPEAPTSTETGFAHVIQNHRQDGHISLALSLPELRLDWGDRLCIQAGEVHAEAFYHGPMKAWSVYNRIFGKEAAAALEQDPGIDAYLEGDRVMGGTRVEGHAEWLRLRAATAERGERPLFALPVGTALQLTKVRGGSAPAPKTKSKVVKGMIQAVVLASHPHGMVLSVDAALARKLGLGPDSWLELVWGGGPGVPMRARRGISPPEEERVWSMPACLLFDYEAHWVNEKQTVMGIRPMQMNWRGRFPEAAEVTMGTAPVGSVVELRPLEL